MLSIALALASPALSVVTAQADSTPRMRPIVGVMHEPAASVLSTAWDDSLSAATSFCVTAWGVIDGQIIIAGVAREADGMSCGELVPMVHIHRDQDPRLRPDEVVDANTHRRPFVLAQVERGAAAIYVAKLDDGTPIIGGARRP